MFYYVVVTVHTTFHVSDTNDLLFLFSPSEFLFISISKLRRVLRNVNKSLTALSKDSVIPNSITAGDCLPLYYLFGEPYYSNDKNKLFKDVIREPNWQNTIYNVVQKSNLLITEKNRRMSEWGFTVPRKEISDSSTTRCTHFLYSSNCRYNVLLLTSTLPMTPDFCVSLIILCVKVAIVILDKERFYCRVQSFKI